MILPLRKQSSGKTQWRNSPSPPILVVLFDSELQDIARLDAELYKEFSTHVQVQQFESKIGLLDAFASFEIVHLICSIGANGELGNGPKYLTADEVLAAVEFNNIKLLIFGKDNPAEYYIKHVNEGNRTEAVKSESIDCG